MLTSSSLPGDTTRIKSDTTGGERRKDSSITARRYLHSLSLGPWQISSAEEKVVSSSVASLDTTRGLLER